MSPCQWVQFVSAVLDGMCLYPWVADSGIFSLLCTGLPPKVFSFTCLPLYFIIYLFIYISSQIPKGQEHTQRLEPAAPIRLGDRKNVHYPSRHCTILKKWWLNDGLPAHLIPSTRESLEDVYTYTWHTKSMMWLTFFPAPRGQPVKGWGTKRMAPNKRNDQSGGRRESV